MILTAPAISGEALHNNGSSMAFPKHNHRTTRYVFIFGRGGSRDTGYEIVFDQLRPAGIKLISRTESIPCNHPEDFYNLVVMRLMAKFEMIEMLKQNSFKRWELVN